MLVIEDFKNEKGEWAYSTKTDWKQVFTVGGRYYANMTSRCKSGGSMQKLQPTYIGCSTTFKSRHEFIDWARTQVGYGTGALDKDTLLKGNKVYCSELCVFVPRAVNNLLLKRNALRGEWPIGVCFNRAVGKFNACLKSDGKRKHLGYFTSPEHAYLAYKLAKEAECKRIAEEYKSEIDHRVYRALLEYTVEVSD